MVCRDVVFALEGWTNATQNVLATGDNPGTAVPQHRWLVHAQTFDLAATLYSVSSQDDVWYALDGTLTRAWLYSSL